MYKEEFYITENIWNNALSFEERKKFHSWEPRLFVPSLKKINSPDEVIFLEKDSSKITFEDFGFDDKLSTCFWLEHFYELPHPLTPSPWRRGDKRKMYLFDNHNHAYSFWYLARSQWVVQDNALLYHVDEHADYRDPWEYLMKPESEDLEKVFEYVNFSKINVGNYIIPAEKEGLISKTIQIRSSVDLEEYWKSKEELQAGYPQGVSLQESWDKNEHSVNNNCRDTPCGYPSIILNLDLDFFQPDLDFIDYDEKKKVVLDIAAKADVITVATSPFFIDQKLALRVWKDLFYN